MFMIKPLFFTTFILVLIGGILYFYQENFVLTKSGNPNSLGQKLLEDLDTKELSKITIRGEDSFVSLVQMKGGGWLEESFKYEADSSQIQDLLLKLYQTKLGDLVTNNVSHHKRFKLVSAPENVEKWDKDLYGESVTLLKGDGTIILSILIGNNRKSGQGQYIRYSGSNKVFLIPERLNINTNSNDWLDKKLLELEEKDVKNIKIKSNSELKLNINRKTFKDPWLTKNGNDIPSDEKIQNVLDKLSSLSFSKIIERQINNEKELNPSEDTLFITLFDGRLFTIKIIKNNIANENYILNLRMGILQDSSAKKEIEEKVRIEMESFNKKMNGRFFEISSWEGKELLVGND